MSQDIPVVLVVEDDPDQAEYYARWLREFYTVRTAYTGEQALESLDESVHVVLLDRELPDMDGEAVLARIRERDLACHVAMVTAVEADVDIVEMGFDEYLRKPVDAYDLKDAVDRLLSLHEYQDTLREHFALISKLTALRASLPEDELESSEEVRELEARLERLRPAANRQLDELFERHSDDWVIERVVGSGGPRLAESVAGEG